MSGIKEPASLHAQALATPLAAELWSTLDLGRDGFTLLDSAGQIMQFNGEARRLLHCEDADLSGRDFWSLVAPDIARKHQPACLDAENRREPYSFIVKRELAVEWLECTFSVRP